VPRAGPGGGEAWDGVGAAGGGRGGDQGGGGGGPYRRSSRLITPAPVPITASAVGAQKAYIHLRPLLTSASSRTSSVLSSASRCSSFASERAKLSSISSRRSARYVASTLLNSPPARW